MRLIVTGGCGFIGSAFVRYLFGGAGYGGRVTNLDLLTYAGNPENLAGLAVGEVRQGALDGQRHATQR